MAWGGKAASPKPGQLSKGWTSGTAALSLPQSNICHYAAVCTAFKPNTKQNQSQGECPSPGSPSQDLPKGMEQARWSLSFCTVRKTKQNWGYLSLGYVPFLHRGSALQISALPPSHGSDTVQGSGFFTVRGRNLACVCTENPHSSN